VPDVNAILERLDHEGYRLTGPRRTVLDEVVRREVPFTSADLLTALQAQAPTIGRATVFRTLDLLVRLGLVQRIHEDPEGGRCHAYLACDGGHHHHLICQGCGAVADFAENAALESLMREVAQQTAYRIEGHRLELVGRCPACQAGNTAG
jgi:Fur family ferric uptake transcriptional regulator